MHTPRREAGLHRRPAAEANAATVLAADYFSDHVAHMCMEPLNVTVKAEKGQLISSPATSHQARGILGMIVGKTTPNKVNVHTMLLGGGFGRRADGDDMVMALILALNVPGKRNRLRSEVRQRPNALVAARRRSPSNDLADAVANSGGAVKCRDNGAADRAQRSAARMCRSTPPDRAR
ncbi:molybdopterin cofactor-binding domain-containing protein [Bradyrhizobium sp. 14AA]